MKETANRSILVEAIAGFSPGYFALVMATGIVSIACDLLAVDWLAWGLLLLNAVAYVALWGLTGVRLLRFPARLWGDLIDHERGPGFFTAVAGSCVLGTQILTLTGDTAVPTALWWLAVVLWVGVNYVFFAAVTIGEQSLEVGINGTWLLTVVAAQSIALLGALLAQAGGLHVQLFFSLCMYLFGCLLYVPLITLILYRFIFNRLPAVRLTPPYWINMGAVAITTLTGSTLVLHAERWALLEGILPLLRASTLLFWATATWWIPLLIVLTVWRHVARGVPLRYDPQYWGFVFPLGMYTASTLMLARALELPFLEAIPRVFLFIAVVAWGATFVGLVRNLIRIARRRTGREHVPDA